MEIVADCVVHVNEEFTVDITSDVAIAKLLTEKDVLLRDS